jgi:hypothetical protein
MDAAEYKHVVLGLIFLKYISDALKNFTTNWKLAKANMRAPIPKTKMNTWLKRYFMCRLLHGGYGCRDELNYLP